MTTLLLRRTASVAVGGALTAMLTAVAATALPQPVNAAASPSMTATIVDTDAVAVVGRDFPATATVTFSASATQLRMPETTSDSSGRFAAAALLPAGVTGTIRITATSGSASASASVTVQSQPPSGAPSAVASMSLAQDTPTTMIVSWTTPTSPGSGAVQGYKIGWTELGPPNRVWDSEMPHYPLSASPVKLTNLTPNTAYDVRVTPYNAAGFGPTTTKTLTTKSSGDSTGLREKLVAGYWQMYEGPKVSEITANAPQYNLQYAAFARSASNGRDGSVQFSPSFSSGAELRADISASRRAGSTWLLSIGGGGDYITLLSTANANQMVNSLIPIIDDYGFDGVDFDIECEQECWNVATLKSVAVQLKQHYGAGFIISAAPRPYEDWYRDWAVQMGDQLDLFGYQFYDAMEFNDPQFLADNIRYRINQTVQMGIPASKILIGAITYSQYPYGHNTVDVYANIFKEMERQYPDLRGVFIWETSLDKKEGWSFARGMGRAVLGQ